MNAVEQLRNDIIDKLLAISNQEYLYELKQLIEKSAVNTDIIQLSENQLKMLEMSEDDIQNGRVVSQEELEQMELEWLKER